jgi:hypothetical protein
MNKCEYCGKDKNKCKATINNISSSGDMGTYTESMNSSEIDGIHYINVTEKVLNRYNPYFVRRS